MTTLRRALTMAAACIVAGMGAAGAQEFPTRPIRMIMPYPPGAGTDIVVRLIQPRTTSGLGQMIVVDNRPGASGSIAMELTARAAADGYTLVTFSASLVIYSAVNKTKYDLFRDFQPVTQFTAAPYVLVAYPGLPAKTVKEVIAYAKANPDKLNYASSGHATLQHLATAWFATAADIRMTHVPYKGVSPALPDLAAGRAHLLMASVTSMVPHIRTGRLRPLAVTTAKRTRELPEVETMIEAGVRDFLVTQWIGTAAPKGTPKPVVARLQREMAAALREPAVVAALERDGTDAIGSTPEEFTAHIRAEYEKWRDIAAKAGVKSDR